MRKIALIIIVTFIGISSVFLTLNLVNYYKFQNEIKSKEEKIKAIKNDISESKNIQNNTEKEFEEIKNKKEKELKELKEWQEKIEELKKEL